MNELKSNLQRAQWAAYCLFTHIIILFIFAYLSLKLIMTGPEQLYVNDEPGVLYYFYILLLLLNSLTFLASAITFVMWFRRSYYNLHKSYEVLLSFPEQWAAACWFVPFINLYRPYFIAKEIWNGYQQLKPNVDISATLKSVVGVRLWWFGWLFYNVVYYCCAIIFGSDDTQNTLESEQILTFCTFMSIAPGVLLIHYLKQVSTWEQSYYTANSERDIIEHFDNQE